MTVPDYFLPRPAAEPDVVAFERLWTEQVEPGSGGTVDYRLPEPRWHGLRAARESFDAEPEEDWNGLRLASTQWASPVPVRPLAGIAVRPEDFPFLDRVNGHDPETVVAGATADPDGFPWRE
jgi:hypothetical protein